MNEEIKVSNNKTLLIVDDSKISRMMTKAIITDKQPEINIFEAADGLEALEQSEKIKFDYYSVDYNMPKMDGVEFISAMMKKQSPAKFALLTANIQEATHEKAKKLGAKCFNKPISETCILAILEYFNE